jgi:hypothetical protein
MLTLDEEYTAYKNSGYNQALSEVEQVIKGVTK